MGPTTWMELADAVQRADADQAHEASLFAKMKSDKAKTAKGHAAAADAHKKAAQAHTAMAAYHEEMSPDSATGPHSEDEDDEGPPSSED